jgi:hypothetical protein
LKAKPSPSSNFTPEQLATLSDKVPSYLQVTPELSKEIAEDQEKLREKFSRFHSRKSNEETELILAINYEKAARLALQHELSDEELSFNRRRLAQSLQTQGRYDEAIEILDAEVPLESLLQHELVQEFHALIIPDDEHCSCESSTGFPTTHVTKKIRNLEGSLVPVIRCTSCGHMNATNQVPEQLTKLETFRAGASKKPDSELLKQ